MASPKEAPVAYDEKSAQPQGRDDDGTRLPSSDEAPLRRWNDTKIQTYRYLTTLFSFIVMGMNDACTGALLPYIESYYHVSYTVISLMFLSSFVGYILAALLNNFIHHRFGQIGVAVLGPSSRLVGYIPLMLHPPFPVLPIAILFTGLGNGIEDSAWNAWIGNMQNANELLGILHGCYGLGGTIAPLIATSLVTKGHQPWYVFYYLMLGMAGLEAVLAISAFWSATGREHRASYRQTPTSASSTSSTSTHVEAAVTVTDPDPLNGQEHDTPNTKPAGRITMRQVLREPLTWLISCFLLGYVGVEVSLGGWIVSFMLQERGAENFAAGMSVTGFWLGLTVGRVVLGFITGRIGEKLAISGYLVLCIVLQLLYWLIPSFIASSVFVAFIGFLFGPLFPAAIVAAAKLLPPAYHVSAIGFAAAFGGGGAAVFPFAVGAIAQVKGVIVLQPIALSILVFILIVWCFIPGGMRPGGLERARQNHEKIGSDVVFAYRWLRSKFVSSS